MKAKKSITTRKSALVVLPPPPSKPVATLRATALTVAKKRPASPKTYPAARDSQGKASRTEIRREEPRRFAPRATNRATERSNQQRSHKAGKK